MWCFDVYEEDHALVVEGLPDPDHKRFAGDLLGRPVDDQLHAAIKGAESARDLCVGLVEQANAAGGTDNITVVAARF